jgi:hypothetical protein
MQATFSFFVAALEPGFDFYSQVDAAIEALLTEAANATCVCIHACQDLSYITPGVVSLWMRWW